MDVLEFAEYADETGTIKIKEVCLACDKFLQSGKTRIPKQYTCLRCARRKDVTPEYFRYKKGKPVLTYCAECRDLLSLAGTTPTGSRKLKVVDTNKLASKNHKWFCQWENGKACICGGIKYEEEDVKE